MRTKIDVALVVLFLLALVALSGCATAPPERELFKMRSGARGMAPAVLAVENDVDRDFRTALNDCNAVLARFEGRARQASEWSLGLHLVGVVAGVLGSFAGSPAVWAAVAGTMNSVPSLVREEGLDAGTALRNRALLLAAIEPSVGEYALATSTGDTAKARAAVSRIVAACIGYWVVTPGAPPLSE
jgi:hypothetical protein